MSNMLSNALGKFGGCSGLKSGRYGNVEDDSPSASRALRRRLLSLSLTRGRSFNGISPLPSPSGGGPSSSPEELLKLEDLLKTLDKLIDEGESDNQSISTSAGFDSVKASLLNDVPLLGQVLEKAGGSATGQIGAHAANGGALYDEVSQLLKDVGQLHWVGAFLIILAVALNRFAKASRTSEQLRKCLKTLRDFGRHVRRIHGHVKDANSESFETLRKAVQLICEYAAFCSQAQPKKRNIFHRIFYAETDHEKLVSLQNDINQLYPELLLIEVEEVRKSVATWTIGENFEPTEDTGDAGMVGNEKRVQEAYQKLTTEDNTKRVRALVLIGMSSIGKSTVGQYVAAKLKGEKNFDDYSCCKIHMCADGADVKVNEKQQELYAKLSRGEQKLFPVPDVGKRELQKLFENRAQPALMYFDDAHKPGDLDRLLPSHLDKSLHPGSILVVTTTNERVSSVLEAKGVICLTHTVRKLPEKDAKTLLLQKTFGNSDISSDSEHSPLKRKLVKSQQFLDLLNFCDGVPLAITVVGSSIWIKGRDYLQQLPGGSALRNLSFDAAYAQLKQNRDKFLKKLQDAVNHALIALSEGDPIALYSNAGRLDRSLQFACDQLAESPRIKEVFLDIVAVHLGRKWEDVERICGAEDLDTLQRMSMVKRSLPDGILHVHPLLIGKAKRLENDGPPGRRVVVTDEPALSLQVRNSACTQREIQVIKLDHVSELSGEQLDHATPKLQFLEVLSTDITGNCRTPPNLKYYRSLHSPLPFVLNPYQLRKLEILDLEVGLHEESNVHSIQSMPSLQKLKLKKLRSLKYIGPDLKKLRIIIVEDCPDFEDTVRLNPAVVQEFRIANCPKFNFPSVNELNCLERLSLVGFEFTKLPESFVVPPRVQLMDLSRNRNLKELPAFAQGNKVEELNLRFCASLELRWEAIRSVTPNLEYLDLGGCAALERLPSLPDDFPRLKFLDVQGCPKVFSSEFLQLDKKMKQVKPRFRMIGLPQKDAVPLSKPDAQPRFSLCPIHIWCDGEPGGCGGLRVTCSFNRSLFGKPRKKTQKRDIRQCSTFPKAKYQ